MSSMEQGLVQRLISSNAITSLIGTSPARVQWLRRPQSSALPSITLQVISRVPVYSDEGSAGLIQARVQIDCWGDDFIDVVNLAAAVTLQLATVTWGSAQFNFVNVVPENTIDFSDTEQGETPIYRRMLEYTLWYYEQEL